MNLCLHSINSNSVYLPSVVNVYINTKKLFFYNITFYWTDSNMAQSNSIENPLSLRAKVCIAASNDLQISYTIVLLVINVLLSIIASLGNTLILFALHKECALHPPSKLLFRCLALTDLLVGCSHSLCISYIWRHFWLNIKIGEEIFAFTLQPLASSPQILCAWCRY